MERVRVRSLAVPAVPAKTQAPRLRRKLQKSVTRQRSNGPTGTRRAAPDVYNEGSSDNKSDTRNTRTTAAQAHPRLPLLAPDLSDSKWSDCLLRETGCFCTTTMESLPLPREHSDGPVQIIPELSHLAIKDANPRNSVASSSDLPASPTQTMNKRRHAKTPIFSIGQLENIPRPGNALASEKRLSAEAMAEQYRALIASRNSILKETHSEPSISRQGFRDGDLWEAKESSQPGPTPPRDTDNLRLPDESMPPPLPNGSPTTSDDGTLVGFEEETVYFKPVSFSPEPMSPHFEQRYHLGASLPPTPAIESIPGNLSLQICLDLLTRDLSSGLKGAGINRGDSDNTSALQVWVMIEAFERLRDQLFAEENRGRVGLEELAGLGMMMDMWLRALYTIHDGLVGGGGHDDVSHYEGEFGMEMEELD